jgi:PAS domain S-box-containing protein
MAPGDDPPGSGRAGTPPPSGEMAGTVSGSLRVIAGVVAESLQPQMLFDVGRRLVAISGPARELRPDWELGALVEDGFEPARQPEAEPLFARVLAGSPIVYRDWVMGPDGTLPMEGTIQAVQERSGPIGLLVTFQVVPGVEGQESGGFLGLFGRNLERFPVAVVEVDADFRVTRWSARATNLFEWSPAEAIGRRVSELIVPEDERVARESIASLALDLGGVREAAYVTRSGARLICERIAVPIVDRAGHARAYLALFTDVTERVRAQHEVSASEAQFRGLLQDTPLMAVVCDPHGRIVFANSALCDLVGRRPDQVQGLLWDDAFGSFPDDQAAWDGITAERVIPRLNGHVRDKDGDARMIAWTNSAVCNEAGELMQVASLGEDITERRRLEQRLRLASQERLGLLSDLLNAEEAERERLAEALHDDTIQVLTAAIFQLDRIARQSPSDGVEQLREMLSGVCDRTRTLMFELRPASLIDLGLRSAVESLCAHAGELASMRVTVEIGAARYPRAAEELCYRSIREAVLNAQRHSEATVLTVTVNEAAGELVGVVADNGVGFDANGADPAGGLHMGMHAMQERIRVAGGQLDVSSRPGEGTTVRFRIPLAGDDAVAPELGGQDVTVASTQPLWVSQWTAIRGLPDAYMLSTLADGVIIDVSAEFCNMLGYTRTELVGRRSLDLGLWAGGHAARGRLTEHVHQDAVAKGVAITAVGKGGRQVHTSINAVQLHDPDLGDLLLLSVRDVTGEHEARTALESSEALYRAVTEIMREGIVVQDTSAAILACNSAAERMLGLTRDQLVGRTSFDPRWRAVHEDGSDFPGDTHPAVESLRTHKPVSDVIMGVHKPSGELTWIAINTHILNDSDGSVKGVVCTFDDITDRRAHTPPQESG